MNPPVFGNPWARLLGKIPAKPQQRHPILSMSAKCERKGHRPPRKDGRCSRCGVMLVVEAEVLSE